MLDIVVEKSLILFNTFNSFLSWVQRFKDVRLLLSW
jgi:hypothetical protein